MADNSQVGTIGWIDMTVDDEDFDASAAAGVEKGGAVIVSPRQGFPPFSPLAQDISFTGFPLGIEGIETLLKAFFR